MKRKITLTIILTILLSTWIYAQKSITIPVSSVNSARITQDVDNYINIQMTKWKVKGKYETTADYAKRQSPEMLELKTQEYKRKKVNEIAVGIINLAISNAVYNADSQAFKMALVGLPPFYLHVTSDNGEAFIFEKNLDKISFNNPVFDMDKNGFYIAKVDAVNNYNQKTYPYPYIEPKPEEINQPTVQTQENKEMPIVEESQIAEEMAPEKSSNYIKMPKVGIDLPASTITNPNAVAVVIGNSEYEHTSNVKYAVNDAELMKKYLIEVLGYKEGNVFFETNITKGTFENYFGTRENSNGKLSLYVKSEISDVFIYYAGHGFPDKDGNVYFLPKDAEPNIVQLGGYPMNTFYNNISKLNAKSVTIILDACFSGFGIQRSVSGVRIVEDVKEEIPNGSIMTSSAASQESTWLDQEKHGMFTYFFMRALHDKEIADVNKDRKLTIGEIYDYVADSNEGVPYYARRINHLDQHPEFKGDREKVMMEY